jgi:hypothetical protein
MNNELRAVWERYVRSWKEVAPAQKQAVFPTCPTNDDSVFHDAIPIAPHEA